MPGDIGRIPILSLSGCQSLTDVVSELPVPQSTHVSIGCRTLLYDSKLVVDAYRCINNEDARLTDLLTTALGTVGADDMDERPQITESIELPVLLRLLNQRGAFDVSRQGTHTSALAHGTPNYTKPLREAKVEAIKPLPSKDCDKSYSAIRLAPLRISIKKTSFEGCFTEEGSKSKGSHRSQINREAPATPHSGEVHCVDALQDRVPLMKNVVTAALPVSPVEHTSVDRVDQPPKSSSSQKSSPILPVPTVTVAEVKGSQSSPPPMTIADTDTHGNLISTPSSTQDAQTSMSEHCPSLSSDVKLPVPAAAAATVVSVATTTPVPARRVPDPALSQLFHSAVLFHPYQTPCETEKSGSGAGGGLFDDWIDSSSKPPTCDPPNCTIPNDCPYSGSISGPSSVAANLSHLYQAPNSVGAICDPAIGNPRSPQSGPSGCSSYPATPGGYLPNASCSANCLSTIVSPSKGAIATSTISSPTVRSCEQFNMLDIDAVGEPPRVAPHGLAAYLPRSTSGPRPQPHGDDASSAHFSRDLRLTSPKSTISPGLDSAGPRSVSASESGSRPTSTGKGASKLVSSTSDRPHQGYADSYSPAKLNNRSRYSSGKPKAGSRRRRTEVEELRMWNVNDGIQLADQKGNGACEPDPTHSDSKEVDSEPPNHVVEMDCPVIIKSSEQTIPPTDSAASHGQFSEALVERVKRRRQQRDVESRKRTSQRTELPDFSPASSPSPKTGSGKSISSLGKALASKITSEQSPEVRSCERTQIITSSIEQKTSSTRNKLLESDTSLSPGSTALSSVRSSVCDGLASPSPDNVPTPLQSSESSSQWNPSKHTISQTASHLSGLPLTHSSVISPKDCDIPVVKVSSEQHEKSQPNSDESFPDASWGKRASEVSRVRERNSCRLPRLEEIQIDEARTLHPRNVRRDRHSTNSPRPPSLLPLNSPSSSFAPDIREPCSKLTDERHQPQANAVMHPAEKRNRSHQRQSNKTPVKSQDTIAMPSNSRIEDYAEYSDAADGHEACQKQNAHNDQKAPEIDQHVDETDVENKFSPFIDQSVSSALSSSSPPVPYVADGEESYTTTYPRCPPTPSTIPYTHSSGMEESSEDDVSAIADDRENQNHPTASEPHSTVNANGNSSASCSLFQSSDPSDSDTPAPIKNRPSPPGELSTHSSADEKEANRDSADSDTNVEQTRVEELTAAAACLAQFTAHLSKILRRVEELDLLKLTSVAGSLKPMEDDFEDGSQCVQMIPDSARLSRSELRTFYAQLVQIHLGGSMYTIPTGHLVRFLTLLLVNMQIGSQFPPSPLTPEDVCHYLERHKQGSSSRASAEQVTESILWANSHWASVLTGLDCARIALNILVAPDMPRPLLMEDLIEGIITVVKRAVDDIVCRTPASLSATKSRSGGHSVPHSLSARNLWQFSSDCVGYRVSQIMAVLSSLIRFQPNRFTDTIILRLTSLCLAIPLHCLKTGQSLDRDPKRLASPLYKRLLSSAHDHTGSRASVTGNAIRLWLLVWPSHLQRACLSLLAGVYGQYDAHRKSIADEIFSAVLGLHLPAGTNVTSDDSGGATGQTGDRRTVRRFRLLSCHWLYTIFKQSDSKSNSAIHGLSDDGCRALLNSTTNNGAKDDRFLNIHIVTAVFLTLAQSLGQAPGSLSSNLSGGSARASGKKSTSAGEQQQPGREGTGESLLLNKDEKHVLNSYNACVRCAHHLLSGLLRKVCTKSSLDLRPLLETVTSDLISVAQFAPIEWPISFTLIGVLSNLVFQHLNQSGSGSNQHQSGNTTTAAASQTDLSAKVIYLDTLVTLAVGLKQNPHWTPSTDHANPEDPIQSEKTTLQARLISFLSSPMLLLQHWLLEPGVFNQQHSESRQLSGECMKWVRLEYTDCLLQNAQRFLLVSWFHECTRELGGAGNGMKVSLDSSLPSKHSQELDRTRYQLLSELALTHHAAASSISWLSGSTKQSGAIVGSSSLSSPTPYGASRLSRSSNTTSTGHGSRSGGGATPNKFIVYGGSLLAQNEKTQRIVRLTNTRHRDCRYRLWMAAHAHWSAEHLLFVHPATPGFEKFVALICRLIGEPSVPLRTKALRCLASLIELDPSLLVHANKTADIKSAGHNGGSSNNSWARDLPRLVHARLLDNSTAVREAAVDLVSRLLLSRPRLVSDYYPMMAERVLDKGVSVRKRAIRCLRDLLVVNWNNCHEDRGTAPRPRFKSTLMTKQLGLEMCLKLIRRLRDDEESIQVSVWDCMEHLEYPFHLHLVRWERIEPFILLSAYEGGVSEFNREDKLVIELFQNLWLTPINESNVFFTKLLDRRIINLGVVTFTLWSGNLELLEASMKQILSTGDSGERKRLEMASVQLINRLVVLVKRFTAPFFTTTSSTSSTTRKRNKAGQSAPLFPPALATTAPPPPLQCFLTSLHLLSRCKPQLLLPHCAFFVDLIAKAPLTNVSATPSGSSSSNGNAVSAHGDAPTGIDVQSLAHLISVIDLSLSAIKSIDGVSVRPEGLSDTKLRDLQRVLIRLIQRQGRVVVDSSISCLAALVNHVLHDYGTTALVFEQFYDLLNNVSFELRKALSTKIASTTVITNRTRPSVLRALYTVGLMCKYFRMEDLISEHRHQSANVPMLDDIVDTLMLFAEYAAAPVVTDSGSGVINSPAPINDPDLCRKAVMGLSFLVCRHDRLLCTKRVRTFFARFFTSTHCTAAISTATMAGGTTKHSAFNEIQCIVLDTLTHYLLDNERQMVAAGQMTALTFKSESLKELNDRRSGHASAVAQEYLPIVLKHCILTAILSVRSAALGLVSIIVRQGLVHPVQTIPALICLQADPDSGNRLRASHLLVEAERKVPGFVAMRAASGLHMSYQLHVLLQLDTPTTGSVAHIPIVRGVVPETSASPRSSGVTNANALPSAWNHAIYAMLRSNRRSRRSFLSNLLALFAIDDKPSHDTPEIVSILTSRIPSVAIQHTLGQLIFITDQLVHFPYLTQDEVFYVAYTIERLVSDYGPPLLRLVQQVLLSSSLQETSSPKQDELQRQETYILNLLEAAETKLSSMKQEPLETGISGSARMAWDDGGRLGDLFRTAKSSARLRVRKAILSVGPLCSLLLSLRNQLRDIYGVLDSKLRDYSPSDSAKQWDKPIQTVKRTTSGSTQVALLPSLVVQCMNNPQWMDLTIEPPDTFILYHFIRLYHQVFTLEGSQSATGGTPTPVDMVDSHQESVKSRVTVKTEPRNDTALAVSADSSTMDVPDGELSKQSARKSQTLKAHVTKLEAHSDSRPLLKQVRHGSSGHKTNGSTSKLKRKARSSSSESSSLSASSSASSSISESSRPSKPIKRLSSANPIRTPVPVVHQKDRMRKSHEVKEPSRSRVSQSNGGKTVSHRDSRASKPALNHGHNSRPQPHSKEQKRRGNSRRLSRSSSSDLSAESSSNLDSDASHPQTASAMRKPTRTDPDIVSMDRVSSVRSADPRGRGTQPSSKSKRSQDQMNSASPVPHKSHVATAYHEERSIKTIGTNRTSGIPTHKSRSKLLEPTSSRNSNSTPVARTLAPLPDAMMQPSRVANKPRATLDKPCSSKNSKGSVGKTAVYKEEKDSRSLQTTNVPSSKQSHSVKPSSKSGAAVRPGHVPRASQPVERKRAKRLSESSTSSSEAARPVKAKQHQQRSPSTASSGSSSSSVSSVSTPSDCSLDSSSTISSTSPVPVKPKKSRKISR